MLDKKYFQTLRVAILSYTTKRREVIKAAGDAQHLSKKAIFALQRDDSSEAVKCLSEAEKQLSGLYKRFKTEKGLTDEGSYLAGLEEWLEAKLFQQFLAGEKIGQVKCNMEIDPDLYISGLCDVPGELLRYAIKSATERKFDIVKKSYDTTEAIISELVDMDLTGYNRTKFDQAKGALHKLQQIVYETSLKK